MRPKTLAVWVILGAILPLGYRDYEIATDMGIPIHRPVYDSMDDVFVLASTRVCIFPVPTSTSPYLEKGSLQTYYTYILVLTYIYI